MCVKCIPSAGNPPWPPITAIAPAFCSAFKKSPYCAKMSMKFFLGVPSGFIITILPLKRLMFFEFAVKIEKIRSDYIPPHFHSPQSTQSSPWHLLKVRASTVKGVPRRAVPRVQPFHTEYFSACTFLSPIAFIFVRPQLIAF